MGGPSVVSPTRGLIEKVSGNSEQPRRHDRMLVISSQYLSGHSQGRFAVNIVLPAQGETRPTSLQRRHEKCLEFISYHHLIKNGVDT